jgi:hypothetical protein
VPQVRHNAGTNLIISTKKRLPTIGSIFAFALLAFDSQTKRIACGLKQQFAVVQRRFSRNDEPVLLIHL